MTLLESIFMGVLQGIAEFLPISSSGHLALMKQIMKIETDTGLLFDIILHLGTLAAVFVVYWRDIWELIKHGFGIIKNLFRALTGKIKFGQVLDTPYKKFVVLIIVSTIPTGILGVLMKDFVEFAGGSLLITGICLVVTSVILVLTDMIKPGSITEKGAGYKDAAAVGVVQGLATMPGVSRSGSTIFAGMMCGFSKEFAVKYSFIMSIPAILGAVVLDLKDFTGLSANAQQLSYYLIGAAVAAVVGYISIRFVLQIIKRDKFKYFGFYCFVIGVTAILYHFVLQFSA